MVNAPFREYVVFFFGRSKRFRAEDLLPGSLLQVRAPNVSVRRIDGFLSGTPGLQVSWHEFVCMARSVLVSTVRKLGQSYVGGSVARGFIFMSVFRVCPTFAVMLLLFGAVCSVFSWYWPSLEARLYGLGKGISSQRSSTCAGPRVGSS